MSHRRNQLSFFISTASLPVEGSCLIFPFGKKFGGGDFIDKKVDDARIANPFELLNVRGVVVIGKVFQFLELHDEFVDRHRALFQVRHLVMCGGVFVSFSESFHECGNEQGEGKKAEITIHVIVIVNLVNKVVGPRTGGSSSHIGEGKNDFPPYGGELWTSCFEVQPELVDEGFRLVAISCVGIGNISLGLLFNDDRCSRRSRRRNRWRIVYRWRWYGGLVPKMDPVRKVLRFKHRIERFSLDTEKLKLSSDVVVSGHDCRR